MPLRIPSSATCTLRSPPTQSALRSEKLPPLARRQNDEGLARIGQFELKRLCAESRIHSNTGQQTSADTLDAP